MDTGLSAARGSLDLAYPALPSRGGLTIRHWESSEPEVFKVFSTRTAKCASFSLPDSGEVRSEGQSKEKREDE